MDQLNSLPHRTFPPSPSKPSLPESLGRLRSALADRYRLDREAGAGGMATVYLAQDIRVSGGTAPVWARSGRELFYVNGRQELVSIELGPGSGAAAGHRCCHPERTRGILAGNGSSVADKIPRVRSG